MPAIGRLFMTMRVESLRTSANLSSLLVNGKTVVVHPGPLVLSLLICHSWAPLADANHADTAERSNSQGIALAKRKPVAHPGSLLGGG